MTYNHTITNPKEWEDMTTRGIYNYLLVAKVKRREYMPSWLVTYCQAYIMSVEEYPKHEFSSVESEYIDSVLRLWGIALMGHVTKYR